MWIDPLYQGCHLRAVWVGYYPPGEPSACCGDFCKRDALFDIFVERRPSLIRSIVDNGDFDGAI
jgi:hypothetical protein